MGIGTRVDQVCFNITDDCGDCTEYNCHDESHPHISCCVVALNYSFSCDDNDMVASEEWLTNFSKYQTNSSHTEDKYMI